MPAETRRGRDARAPRREGYPRCEQVAPSLPPAGGGAGFPPPAGEDKGGGGAERGAEGGAASPRPANGNVGVMVFEYIIRSSPRRRPSHPLAEGFSPTASPVYLINFSKTTTMA